VVTLDIEAGGEVYIGPRPPTSPQPQYTKTTGRGWLARIFESLGATPAASPPPSAAATPAARQAEDIAAEREVILRMVAEGKISAEEGYRLLEALE
jgi:hypothetical protein